MSTFFNAKEWANIAVANARKGDTNEAIADLAQAISAMCEPMHRIETDLSAISRELAKK